MGPNVLATTHFLDRKNNTKYASYFVMNECISLKFLYKSKTQYCVHKKKKNQRKVFLLKYYENCLKSDLKHAKYRNQLEIFHDLLSCSD